jgi:hypothetical protein
MSLSLWYNNGQMSFYKKKLSILIFFAFLLGVSLSCRGEDSSGPSFRVALDLKKIAIFPFSDHTLKLDRFLEARYKEKRIVNQLRSYFESRGISLVLQDFVERVLLTENVIRPLSGVDNPASYFWNIVNSTFSNITNSEIYDYIIRKYGKTQTLPDPVVVRLANILEVDAIVRGVILDRTPKSIMEKDKMIKLKQKQRLREKLIPFFIGDRMSYALAKNYEAGLPLFSNKRPLVFMPVPPDKKVIKIIIFVQSGKTGEVVWSNSCEMAYQAENGYFPVDFSRRLKAKVNLTIDDFFSSLSPYKDSWLFIKNKDNNDQYDNPKK